VFASILAGQKEQIFLGMGGLVGGGLFVNTVVVAAVLTAGGDASLEYGKYLRDSGTYFLTLLLLLVYGLIGEVALWQAVLLPVMYVIYVLVVLLTERRTPHDNIEDLELPVLQSHGSIVWGSLIEDYVKTETASSLYSSNQTVPAHSFKRNLTWSLLRLKFSWENS
jgi:Ca2+/Na+ antiporter